MLQWDWPKTWSGESTEAIRVSIEKAIRKAMSRNKKSQIRGTVSIGELNMGSVPPEISLSGIRALSAEHVAIMARVRYSGNFSVQLRGLEINLDTVSASADEADENLALPFYCPFEMTLQDICLDGMVSIELLHEFEEAPHLDCAASAPAPRPRERRVRPVSARGRPGYGVLLGGGGRHGMRPPGALDALDATLSSVDAEGTLKSPSQRAATAPSFADILTKRAVVKSRTVKLQLFGDPLKSFRVASNFSSVPGANSKVEGTIKMLIKPAIEGLMEDGIVFAV